MIPELAKRFGIDSERVIRKAQEYERLIKLKATAASGYQINVSSQMVISLDLAAKTENITIDKDLSLKLSGLKKPAYNATKHTIKQVLGLNENLPTKDLCVQLGCPEIVDDVENLLAVYCKQSCNGQQDLDHPGFKSAAIMALSKVKKLGVDRPRLHEMSGFKKTVFDKLVVAMVALQQQANPEPTAKPKTATKRSKNFIEAVEARAKALEVEDRLRDADPEVEQVDFAAWKRRMLEEAAASK